MKASVAVTNIVIVVREQFKTIIGHRLQNPTPGRQTLLS
jgi:hypothetical protein